MAADDGQFGRSFEELGVHVKTRMVISLVVGLIIGLTAGYVYPFRPGTQAREGSHTLQPSLREKLSCRELAEKFVKSRSNADTTMRLEMVDYSTSRRSCVAAVDSATSSGRVAIDVMDYEVIDVLTNDRLFWESCHYSKGECGGGKDIELIKERDRVFNNLRAAME
jgi:hypothetical protein